MRSRVVSGSRVKLVTLKRRVAGLLVARMIFSTVLSHRLPASFFLKYVRNTAEGEQTIVC